VRSDSDGGVGSPLTVKRRTPLRVITLITLITLIIFGSTRDFSTPKGLKKVKVINRTG
jgi:hypothetical protein